jgi:hypothetical protein
MLCSTWFGNEYRTEKEGGAGVLPTGTYSY